MTTNSDLLQRRAASVPRGIGSAMGIFAARAENAELWDVEGRRYIDFAAPAREAAKLGSICR